ncbi:uncharacterized protein DS421_2g51200 [Arachis hypogaea]|nr:uncharacterized protein DS421_2g51200 [Arachis hypogaea]
MATAMVVDHALAVVVIVGVMEFVVIFNAVVMDTEEEAVEESRSLEKEKISRDTTGRSKKCILASSTMVMQFGEAEMIQMAIDGTEDKSQLQHQKFPTHTPLCSITVS